MDTIQIMKLSPEATPAKVFYILFAVTSGNAPPVLPSWRGFHSVD
jgi:hypothetical protein